MMAMTWVRTAGMIAAMALMAACGEVAPEELVQGGGLSEEGEGQVTAFQSPCYASCNTTYSCIPKWPWGYDLMCPIYRQRCYERCGLDQTLPPQNIITFYAVGDGNGDYSSDVYSFIYDNTAGAIISYTKLGESGLVLTDVAMNGSTGQLYATDDFGDLYRLNSSNGSPTYVGSIGTLANALEFCSDSLLSWGLNQELHLIDPVTADGSSWINTGHTSAGDMGCSQWGILYGISTDSGGNALVKLSRMGLTPTKIGYLGYSNVYGFEIDQGDKLYAATASSTTLTLLKVDPNTGAATVAATYPTPAGIHGLAIRNMAY